MMEKLSYLEQQLKFFILNNSDFLNLAKKYTFTYRDFTPFIDYCKIIWNKEEKKWEFVGYYCHNQNKKFPNKQNIFFLNLNIDGYSWGSLFSEIENQFNNYLENNFLDEEIEKNSDKYKELRDPFFKQRKHEILNSWFKLNEVSIKDYFKRTLRNLRIQRFEKVNRLKH